MSPLSTPEAIEITEWSGPQKCRWRGCTSRATFRSPSSLEAHIKNVHVSPLVCTHPGCSYKKPFGKQCDLKRHLTTIHSTKREYQCLEGDCGETFSRKDKMLKHAREKHQLFRCSWNHCGATVFASEREFHARESHGPYECAVGSCQSGERSCFQKLNLQRHLRTVHQIAFDQSNTIMNRLSNHPESTEETKAFDSRTRYAQMVYPYQDCKVCLAEKLDEE
jgi:Zinc finger, C2H2 type